MTPRGAPERAPSRLFLVGFMASGKSRVGRRLARLLGRPFMDTDRLIELARKESVSRLLETVGEAAFRRLEERAVSRAARRAGAVVAVGGGAVLRAANVRRMRASGLVVYLSVPFPRLWKRAVRDGLSRRALLRGQGRRAAAGLLARRRPLYRKAAHLVVDGSGPADGVARRIAARLGR